MTKRVVGIALTSVLCLAMAAPAAAQDATITPVLEAGLDAPRGMAFAPDGTLYVAESGAGGTEACVLHVELAAEEPGICYAASGGISAIVDGQATRVIDGLPSGITPTGDVLGVSDVAVDEMGDIWFTVGLGGSEEYRASIPDGFGEDQGYLFKADGEGGYAKVADFMAFEVEHNPDAQEPGNAEPDSNPNSVLVTDHGTAVADSGGNSLILVDADGNLTVGAVFPVAMTPFMPDPEGEEQMIPVDPVPTSVAMGPDGAYYVGMLTGFPFLPGTASVYRVAPGEDPTVYASGFTNVIDVAFGADDALYVLELSHDGLLNADPAAGPPRGGLWRVPAGGGEPELIASDGLVMPGGMAIDADGVIFISTCAICPGGGGIVSVSP
jgi:sugar lactone lactonase YvrE